MTETSLQPASMLDLITKAAATGADTKTGYTPLGAEMYPIVSNCLERRTPLTPHAPVENRGGVGLVRPEADARDAFALLKDASDYPLLPQDPTGRSRFFVAVRHLVDAIADAYGCDDCPGDERAKLHQQAADSVEAIKCFVLLARQAGIRIGFHPCWTLWGVNDSG